MSAMRRSGSERCEAGRIPAARSGRVRAATRASSERSAAVRDFIDRRSRRAGPARAGAVRSAVEWPAGRPDVFGWRAGGVAAGAGRRIEPVQTPPGARRGAVADGASGERAGRGAGRGAARASGTRRPGQPEAADRGRAPSGPAPRWAVRSRAGRTARAAAVRSSDHPIRLTRRGRLVLLGALLILCGLAVIVVAAPGRAADPARPPATAVVQPGDTLWSFAERNAPRRDPRSAIDEIRRLNNLEGYVIHPGQRLVLPRRR